MAALQDAIQVLGGALTPAQEQALLVLSQTQSRARLSAGPPFSPSKEATYLETTKPREPLRAAERPGRNEACWCGSGKKYKRCHLLEDETDGTL